jgi:hypothetical protein
MSRRPTPDLSLPTVSADFNGVDAEGYPWLHGDQTGADPREHDVVMADGLRLIASDGTSPLKPSCAGVRKTTGEAASSRNCSI